MRAWHLGIVITLIALSSGLSDARSLRHGTVNPCSVFDNHPCMPTFCSVFDRQPCVPEPQYGYGQDLRLTIDSDGTYEMPDHDLNTIRDVFAALRACWQPPDESQARAGMQMSVRFSFRRDGQVIAPPRITYATPDVPSDTRQVYRDAINKALERCTPLLFTKGLGGAIAGRSIAVRYVDNRPAEQKELLP
jgi:hypothetical protein